VNGRRSRHLRRTKQQKPPVSTKAIRELEDQLLALRRDRQGAYRAATEQFNATLIVAKEKSVEAKANADRVFEAKRAKIVEQIAREKSAVAA
jgi:hypothetical protein